MKKVLIQVVSVITLVFGTCYQSVLALADDRSRTELSGVQLSDSEGNKLHQVKVNETSELEMTVTVNNKDGENAKGSAAMWLPEDQMAVLKDEVKAESAVADTNATLIYERRKKEQPQLKWKNVETTATFKLKLPVQFKTTMTKMILPVALGTQRAYLPPLTVVKENTNEEDMAQAGEATELPANLLQSLTSFIASQNAQQAAQAEAPVKDDNDVKDIAKEDTEDQRQADKKAEQDAEDQKKETAKTDDVLKKNSKSVTAESKSDGAEREGQSKKATRDATDLGELLKKNAGEKPLDQTLFNTATLKSGDEEIDLTDSDANVTDLENFELIYTWDSPTLLKKLGNYQIQENDYYTFKIYGSSLRDGQSTAGGDLVTPDKVKYAEWHLVQKEGYQEVKITFTNEMVNKTTVLFDMEIKQTYSGSNPIVIEFDEEKSITVDPIVTEKLLAKDGVFIGNNQIRWTVDLDTSGKVNGRTMTFSDIKLVDTLLLGGNNQNHAFADMQSWTAKAADGTDLKNNFRISEEREPLTVSGVTSNDVQTDKITFTFITEYEAGTVGQFGNKVGGSIGDGINLDEVSAHVSTSELNKKYLGYDKDSKLYSWNVDVLLNLDQFSTIEEKRAALRSLTLTDTLTGPHVFKKAQLDLHVTVPTSKEDLAEYFIDSLPTVDDPLTETKELVLKLKADISNAELDMLIGLLEKDDKNKSGQTLSIAYKTVESGKGGLDEVKNSMKLKWDGGLHDSGDGPGSQKGDLIVKSGDLQRDEIYEDGLAHVKWQIEVNKEERIFDTLKVVDVLPNGVKIKDIKSIKVGNTTYNMNKFENGVLTDGGLKITQGYANPTAPKNEKLYDFSETKGDRTNRALLFEFDNTFKGKINIEMETTHEWEKGSPKNYVGALINDSLHEYADGTATIPDRVKANAFKDGKLQLKDQDLESKNNAVQWSIGIGSRLNTYFGTGTNHVNKVKVEDIINGKDGDEAKYLSFLEDTSNYKLYSASKDAYEKDKGSKELIPTTGNDAQATIVFNGDESGDKAEITIEFNEKAKDNQYSFLILEFETPFDLKAWEEFNKDKDSVTLPKVHTFLNDATVSYDYKGQEIQMDVSAHAELNAKEMYGSKTAEKMDNNQIQWEAILNGTGLNIGKPVITDTLKGNHLHDLDNNAIEISLVDVVYEQVTYPDGTTGRKAVVVNPDDAEKLTLDEDYKIHRDGQKMTITFNEDGPDITQPILLRYKTTVVSPDGEFSNKVSISGKGYTGEYTKDYEIKGGAFAKAWGTRFLKVDGDDKDKKLSGAKFKLQWSKPGANDWSDATDIHGNAIPELISDEQGFIQFNMLGDIWEYRLIETETPEGYENSQLTELLFSYADYKEDNWAENTPTIENRTTMPANLMISKKVEKLDNVNNFNFEVRSVDEKGKLDTYLNGQYTLYRDGKPEGSVTFTNGISEGIKLDAGETVTIKGLPVKKVDGDGKKIDRHYDVRETSDSPDYTTSVQVDNGTVTRGKKTEPFTLDESGARDVGVYFKNTAAKGDLIVNKTVSSETESELDKTYKFTIVADLTDKVKGNTYKNEGSRPGELKFNDAGEANFSLRNNEQLRLVGLPEGVKLTVTEEATGMTTTWSINGEDYTEGNSGSAVINTNNPQTMDVKNSTLKSGQLQITKGIAGNIKADEEFEFEIKTDSKNDGTYPAIKYTVSSGQSGLPENVRFTNGVATVKLTGDQGIRIRNLPLGEKFTIAENLSDDSDPNIETSWKTATSSSETEKIPTITLTDPDDIESVKYTNALPHGSLRLNKQVMNQLPGDQAKEFTFEIQAKDGDVSRVAGKDFSVIDNFNRNGSVHFDAEGLATLKLSHDQSVKILGLPAGIQLEITEKNHSGFNVTYDVDGKEDDKDNPIVTIKDEHEIAVNYKNTRPDFGKLTLEKRAEGSYPKDESIKFTIDKLNDDELKLEFDAVRTRADDTTATEKVEFSKGSAEVNIKPGEKLEVKGLPEGQYQVSEETQDDVVTTTWDVGHSQGHNEVADPVMVEKGNPANVQFVNDITTGELELNKLVASDDDADKGKTFNFRVRAVNGTRQLVANKTYEATRYSVTEDVITEEIEEITFDSRGRADIGLKDGQTVTISGLPEGVELRVIERDPQGLVASWNVNHQGGYESTDNRNWPSVNITEGQTEVVSYRNVDEKQVGSLRVAKTVEGAFTDDERQFEFQVTSMNDDGFTGEYDVKVYDRNNKLQEKTTAKVVDGTATIKLKADQYAVIDGLPVDADTKYQVSEVYPGAGMTTTWTLTGENPKAGLEADPVTVDETNVPEITFTNTVETGDLTLKKKLSGEITDTDRNQRFDFTVEAQIEDELGEWKTDETFAGDFLATKTNVDGDQTTSNVTFKDGQLMAPLKGGESLQIHNLPTNLHMVISEAVDGDYEVSHQINQESETPGITTDQIIIESDLSRTVTFINDRPVVPQMAWLSLTKSVLGENGERDREFEFSIRFLDDQMNPLTQTIEYVKTSAIGGIETGQLMLEADGSSTFTLKDGETMRWNVPNGTHYQITESDYTADGYQTGISQGQAPEREGLTATGVAMTNDPVSAKVVYYNRSITPPEEEPHTPEEPDTTDPDFVPPAPESGITTDSSTQTGATPQAHTSDVGTTGSKGFLPQTGEWLAKNWLALLGLVILLSIVGLMAKSQRKND